MRTISLLTLILIGFFSNSCGKGVNSDPENDANTQNKLSAKVNNNAFVTEYVTAAIVPDGTNSTILIKGGGSSDKELVQLSFSKELEAGTYPLALPLNAKHNGYYYNELTGFKQNGYAGSGSLIITEHNKTGKGIKGTFFFTTKPDYPDGTAVSISDGSFEVYY